MLKTKGLLFISLLGLSFNSVATDVGGLSAAAGRTSWGQSNSGGGMTSSVGGGSSTTDTDPTANRTGSTAGDAGVCTLDQQTSLPYKEFLGLFAKKNLTYSHNAYTGDLNIEGGDMIGNCNDMLDLDNSIVRPENDRPYLFNISFRRPGNCTGDKCSYNIYKAEGGIAVGTEVKEYAPNYTGFMQCLADSGVLVNGKLNTDKIAPSSYNKTFSGMHSAGDLLFYSHGPVAQKIGLVYSKKNERNENNCRHYEKVTKDGFHLYSEFEQNEIKAKNLFEKICNSGSYETIDQHLPEFEDFKLLYNILLQVRNIYIKKDVESLHKEMQKKDLSNLDAEKYKKTITDFFKKVIVPLKKKIAKRFKEWENTPSGPERKKLKAELNRLTEELNGYAVKPYLTIDDYRSMKDFAKKAPLHKDAWREAALMAYQINTTAYNYSRYNDKLRRKRDLEVTDVRATENRIKDKVAVEEEKLNRLGTLAEDHDSSHAKEYLQKIEDIKQAEIDRNKRLDRWYNEAQETIANECNRKFTYGLYATCKAEVEAAFQDDVYNTQYTNYVAGQAIPLHQQEASTWLPIEQARDWAYGIKRDQSFYNVNSASQNTNRRTASVDRRGYRTPQTPWQSGNLDFNARNSWSSGGSSWGNNSWSSNQQQGSWGNWNTLQPQQQNYSNNRFSLPGGSFQYDAGFSIGGGNQYWSRPQNFRGTNSGWGYSSGSNWPAPYNYHQNNNSWSGQYQRRW